MTGHEFSNTRFCKTTRITYENRVYNIISVDFETGMIGIIIDDVLTLVFYEDCELTFKD